MKKEFDRFAGDAGVVGDHCRSGADMVFCALVIGACFAVAVLGGVIVMIMEVVK